MLERFSTFDGHELGVDPQTEGDHYEYTVGSLPKVDPTQEDSLDQALEIAGRNSPSTLQITTDGAGNVVVFHDF